MRSVILTDNHLGYIMTNPPILAKYPTLVPFRGKAEVEMPCCPGKKRVVTQDMKPVREALARLTEAEKAEMRRQFSADQLVALRFDGGGNIQRLVI